MQSAARVWEQGDRVERTRSEMGGVGEFCPGRATWRAGYGASKSNNEGGDGCQGRMR